MNKKTLLVLLSNSLGEIHYILPYLRRLKIDTDVDIFFYFINEKLYQQAATDPFYLDQIHLHATILRSNDLLGFLLKRRLDVNLILKDTTPLSEGHLVFKIKALCPNAKLVLFPHAYALLGGRDEPVVQGKTVPVEDRLVEKVLYVHEYDKAVLAQRYDINKFLFAGAYGYTPWWSKEVGEYVKLHAQSLGTGIPKNKMVVLFTLRDVHKTFLSEENFDYLLASAFDVLFKRDCFVIVKPHPRQDVKRIQKHLEGVDPARYTISYLNTLVLAKLVHFNLSFWSSAVTDSLAMGVPSIEFHRFHVPFFQTIDNGELQSFYSYLGLTKAIVTKEKLEASLPRRVEDTNDLLPEQQQALDKVFAGAELGFTNFKKLLEQPATTARQGSLAGVKAYVYLLAKFVFRKIKST